MTISRMEIADALNWFQELEAAGFCFGEEESLLAKIEDLGVDDVLFSVEGLAALIPEYADLIRWLARRADAQDEAMAAINAILRGEGS